MGWCLTPIGWFPCFPTLLGITFLMFVYGPILLLGAKLISISAELLIQVWPPTVVGGLLLPILNSGPLCALIFSASLKGTPEMAQESVRTAMGTVVGDTIMLLTFTWGGSVLLGRCDLDDAGLAMDGVLTRNRTLVGTGVTAVGEVKSGAWVAASSILLFLIVQIPAAWGYAHDPAVLLGGSIAALAAAFAYTGYELALPRIERRGLMHRRKQRLLLHAAAESQQLGEGLSCKQAAEALFRRYDSNRDGSLSIDDITALVRGTARCTPGFVPRRIDVGLWLSLCKQNPEALSIPATAFVRALGVWIQSHKVDDHLSVPGGTTLLLNEEGRHLSAPLLDGEEEDEEEGRGLSTSSSSCSPEEGVVAHPLLKAGALLLLGFGLVAVFADPMVQTVGDFAAVTGIPAFYVSFVISPFASDASECLTSLFFAAKKRRASISLAFSQIYGAVIMTNTLCLSALYAMVWYRGLSWDFSAEVAVCCLVCVAVGGLASRKSTFPTWTGLLALAGYPLSIAAIATLKNMGWH